MPSSKAHSPRIYIQSLPNLLCPYLRACAFENGGGPLRKWTDRGQTPLQITIRTPAVFLTTRLKVNFPEVISPRICIWSFPTLQLYAQQSWEWSDAYSWRNDLWKVNFKRVCEKTAGVLMVIWSGVFGPDPFIFEGGPPPFSESTCPQVWAQ